MTTDELYVYWEPAIIALFGGDKAVVFGSNYETFTEKSKYLERIIHKNHYTKWVKSPQALDEPLSDEDKHLLELLAGPHGKVILKMYQARKK